MLNSHLTKNLPNLAQIQLTKSEIQAILDKQAEIKQLTSQIAKQEVQLQAQIQINCWKPKP